MEHGIFHENGSEYFNDLEPYNLLFLIILVFWLHLLECTTFIPSGDTSVYTIFNSTYAINSSKHDIDALS